MKEADSRPMRKRLLSKRARETLTMYAFLAPAIVGFLCFTLYPTLDTFYMSFFNWKLVGKRTPVGLGNYIRALTSDPRFYQSLKVTLIYALCVVALGLLIGMLLGLLLNALKRGAGVFRAIFYMPCMVAAGAPSMMMWRWIFAKNGLLNNVLAFMLPEKIGWITSPRWVMFSIVLMSLWGIGGTVIIFIAGLKGIPDEYYESAEIDGANFLRKLFSITIPVLTPVILYNLIMGIIGALQTFTVVYVLTGGGPLYQSYFLALYIYDSAFSNYNLGFASALACILFVVVMLLTVLIFRTSDVWVFYGGGVEKEGK